MKLVKRKFLHEITKKIGFLAVLSPLLFFSLQIREANCEIGYSFQKIKQSSVKKATPDSVGKISSLSGKIFQNLNYNFSDSIANLSLEMDYSDSFKGLGNFSLQYPILVNDSSLFMIDFHKSANGDLRRNFSEDAGYALGSVYRMTVDNAVIGVFGYAKNFNSKDKHKFKQFAFGGDISSDLYNITIVFAKNRGNSIFNDRTLSPVPNLNSHKLAIIDTDLILIPQNGEIMNYSVTENITKHQAVEGFDGNFSYKVNKKLTANSYFNAGGFAGFGGNYGVANWLNASSTIEFKKNKFNALIFEASANKSSFYGFNISGYSGIAFKADGTMNKYGGIKATLALKKYTKLQSNFCNPKEEAIFSNLSRIPSIEKGIRVVESGQTKTCNPYKVTRVEGIEIKNAMIIKAKAQEDLVLALKDLKPNTFVSIEGGNYTLASPLPNIESVVYSANGNANRLLKVENCLGMQVESVIFQDCSLINLNSGFFEINSKNRTVISGLALGFKEALNISAIQSSEVINLAPKVDIEQQPNSNSDISATNSQKLKQLSEPINLKTIDSLKFSLLLS